MKNINEYKRRFNTLMESTMGDVKPLLNEIGDDPPTNPPQEVSIPKAELPKIQQSILSALDSALDSELSKNPTFLEKKYGISNKQKFNHLTPLEKEKVLSHTHFHIDPSSKHIEVALPGIGSSHIIPIVGFSYSKGDDSHHGSTGEYNIPHSKFDLGVKIPLNTLFHKSSH